MNQALVSGPNIVWVRYVGDPSLGWTDVLNLLPMYRGNVLGVSIDAADNIYVTGNGPGYLTKFNSDGSVVFNTTSTTTFTASNSQWLTSVDPTCLTTNSAGITYIAGSGYSERVLDGLQPRDSNLGGWGSLFGFVTAINNDGTVKWTDYFGGSSYTFSTIVSIAPDSSVIVCGISYQNFQGIVNGGGPDYGNGSDIFLQRVLPNGQLSWSRLIGGSSDEIAEGLTISTGGYIYVIGHSDGNFLGLNSFIACYNFDGGNVWVRSLQDSEGWDWSKSSTVSSAGYGGILSTVGADGAIYVAGTVSGNYNGQLSHGGKDVFITRFNSDGSLAWSKLLGTVEDDWLSGIKAGTNGAIYLAGAVTPADGSGSYLSWAGINLYSDGQGSNGFLIKIQDPYFNHFPDGVVTIVGNATQGQTLTATNTLADADGMGTISYQWKADGVEITGANGVSLTLGQAQVGKAISVVANYTDSLGALESVSSTATASVANSNDLPTGIVYITGNATQGQTLTATNTLNDADGMGTVSYQWKADGVVIAGATNSTYVLTRADVGETITVAASYVDGFGSREVAENTVGVQVVKDYDREIANAYLFRNYSSGIQLSNGDILFSYDIGGRAEYSIFNESGSNLKSHGRFSDFQTNCPAIVRATADGGWVSCWYQPYLNEGICIQKFNSDGDKVGKELFLSGLPLGGTTYIDTFTTLIDGSYIITSNNYSKAAYIIKPNGDLQALSLNFMTNTSGADGYWNHSVVSLPNGSFDIVWVTQDNGVYQAALDAKGELIRINKINAETDGLLHLSSPVVDAIGDSTVVFWTAFGNWYDIFGKKVNAAGDACVLEIQPNATVDSYQFFPALAVLKDGGWVVGWTSYFQDGSGTGVYLRRYSSEGVAVSDEIQISSYTLGDQDLVGLIALNDGGWIATYASSGSAEVEAGVYAVRFNSQGQKVDFNVNNLPTGNVTINGTATQGQTLTASNTLADADGLGAIIYQWKADGVAIPGATSSSLTLGQAQVGKAISVSAIYTDALGTAESLASATTTTVANVNAAPTGSVTITGTAKLGQTLTATNTLADVDGMGTISYQWFTEGRAIAGASQSSFTITQAQLGKALSVVASYTDGRGTLESVTSNAPVQVVSYNTSATENSTAVTLFAATDPLLGTAPKYTLSGLDASLFKISTKGALTFASAKDFEQPVDTNHDGVYEVSVVMTNSKTHYTVTKDFTVGVEFTPILGTAGADTLKGTTGYDTLDGQGGDDKLTGGAGLDTFSVTSGHDTITDFNLLTKGASGTEILQVSAGATVDATLKAAWTPTADSHNEGTANMLTAGLAVDLSAVTQGQGWNVTNTGKDAIFKGSQFNDVLTGGTGNDQLMGGTGDDLLSGGKGYDVLTGGSGSDSFRLSGDTKTDHITDFLSGTDRIELDNALFKALLTEGQLAANQFGQGTAATTTAQRIVYDQPTGNLWYDADSSGKGKAVLIAVLDNHVQIVHTDFWVI